MSVQLRVFLLVMSVLTVAHIFRKIRRSSMKMEEGIGWGAISILFVIMSAFPEISIRAARVMGVISPVNLIYLVIIGVLFITVFRLSIRLSNAENRINEMAQELAIRDERFNHIETMDDKLSNKENMLQDNLGKDSDE